LIGPWLAQSLGEFKEDTPDSEWKEIFDSLKKTGITCHFGEWLTEGMPKVILVDFQNFGRKSMILNGNYGMPLGLIRLIPVLNLMNR